MPAYSKTFVRGRAVRPRKDGLRSLVVRAKPGDQRKGLIAAGGTVFPCALGHGGITANKREGDGGTPLGRMRILSGYFRNDHFQPGATKLGLAPISDNLGWCEVPEDRNYNRPVSIPYAVSHERMKRDDALYDVCLVLDWNIAPRRRGRGSAIFFHLARPDFTPTQGCVAVTARVMARLLPHLSRRTTLIVTR